MAELIKTTLGATIRMKTDFETALARVIAALKVEGFGILTDIDVKATLKKNTQRRFPVL